VRLFDEMRVGSQDQHRHGAAADAEAMSRETAKRFFGVRADILLGARA
jgi:hypothetical protein